MAEKKKQYDNSLFVYLNWILKKTTEPTEITFPSVFLANRWLSMVDKVTAKIVNGTGNRWINQSSLGKDPVALGRFYNSLLPKNGRRFNYIKKPSKEQDEKQTESLEIAKSSEISQREILLYNHTLEHLKSLVK